MGIYLPNMEMPKDDMKNIMILADGRVFQFSGYGNPKPLGIAVPVPEPHGRLIDADALIKLDRMVGKMMMYGGEYVYTQAEIDRSPTIVPASEKEELT